jgi:hypothetical protein
VSTGVRVFSAIRLASVPDTGSFWIQIATAGEYKGYSDGPVVFDAAFFSKIIANFHTHPWFTPGADGVGTADVVPFDYEHASEADPTSGSIPQGGAPAPAWAQDLQLRTAEDGTAQLWALTRPINDEVRVMLRDGGYKSTSVAVWKSAIDGITGKNIGPVLTSIAFTNHPFIQGMQQIAAKRIAARVEVWGTAESPEELIVGLRDIFELDENAQPAEIQAQLVALAAAYANGLVVPAYPDGVGGLLDRVRRLVNLPVLSTAQQITEAAGQLLGTVSTSQSSPPSPEVTSTMALDAKRLIFALRIPASRLAQGADEEVAILMAAEQGAAATDAISQLQALFGSSETKDLVAKATEAMNNAKKVQPLLDSLAAAQKTIDEQDKESAATDVEDVAARLGLNKDQRAAMVPVLLSQRTIAGKDAETLKKWRTENGVDPSKRGERIANALLSQRLLTGPKESQYSTHQTREGGDGGGEQEHPMVHFAGRNPTEKACNYLLSKREGFKTLSRSKQLLEADKYIKSGAPVL